MKLYALRRSDDRYAHIDALGIYWPEIPHGTILIEPDINRLLLCKSKLNLGRVRIVELVPVEKNW